MYVLIAILILILAGIVVAQKINQVPSANDLAFASSDALFSPAERSFLGVLEQALDDRYRVFGKIRLGDIIKPAKGLTASKRTTAMNRINQKHVDFVVCRATDLAIIGVLELDDQTHGREDRAVRDEFVDKALAMAKIPILRFSAKKAYALQDVRVKLADIIPPEPKQRTDPKPLVIPAPEQPASVAIKESTPLQSNSSAPSCPKCSAAMVKRTAAKGEHAGKLFWACSTFPKCRQVVAVN